MSFLAAVVQLNSTSDEEANLAQATSLIERAAGHGARFIATPENTNFLGSDVEKARRAQPLDGAVCRHFSHLAASHRLHLLLGSFNEQSSEPQRCRNTSVLFGPAGERVAVYRKIHLFDVDVDSKTCFRESATVQAGEDVVIAETDLARVGMSVCYDLRFGELYSRLRRQGAELLTVPSAFTLTTGKDHWEVLVRARAIETQCFVAAPAQWGRHDEEGRRESWGHAMIVDPWGHTLAMAADGPGIALAEIDLDRLEKVRTAIPVADHQKL